tara:strand:+ start:375 stop:884 length:510 start_codon:yes stop_codon:yes gene_type:complete
MYKLEIAPTNANADGKFFNSWLKENYTFTSVSYSEQSLEVWFASEPSDTIKTEITDKYHSLTASDIIPYTEILKAFTKSKLDGEKYFYNFAAENFAIKEATGELTIQNINYIFNRLAPVINRLTFGFWGISLLSLLNDIAPITQGDIDNGYTQELHDKIVLDITNYLVQ